MNTLWPCSTVRQSLKHTLIHQIFFYGSFIIWILDIQFVFLKKKSNRLICTNDSYWWLILMIHIDSYKIHIDGSYWWFILMTHFDDSYWWFILIHIHDSYMTHIDPLTTHIDSYMIYIDPNVSIAGFLRLKREIHEVKSPFITITWDMIHDIWDIYWYIKNQPNSKVHSKPTLIPSQRLFLLFPLSSLHLVDERVSFRFPSFLWPSHSGPAPTWAASSVIFRVETARSPRRETNNNNNNNNSIPYFDAVTVQSLLFWL